MSFVKQNAPTLRLGVEQIYPAKITNDKSLTSRRTSLLSFYMYSTIKTSALEAAYPVNFKVLSWLQSSVARTHLISSPRDPPDESSTQVEAMAAESSHNRWPSADSINPSLASPAQAGNLSSSRSSRSSSAPTVRNSRAQDSASALITIKPRTPQVGDERIIRVFSQALSVLVDCTALLIDENEKNGISIDLVKTLGLEHTLEENAQEETGKFKGMHIVFEGTAVITWSWKEPPLSNHSNPLTCHVIPYKLQRVMLKVTLFTPPALSPRLLNTLDAMVSTPSSPGFSGPLPAPSSLGQSLSPETLGSTAGSSVRSLHAPQLYPEIAGVIDDFGSFYDDSSEKYVH
jgi:hypothetical protein